MKISAVLLSMVLSLVSIHAVRSDEPVALPAVEGMVPLFNGKDFTGFTQKGGKADYKVVDGVMVGTSVTGTPNSFMCTEKLYTNFVLEYEFKVDPKLNSGVQIRSNCHDEEKVFTYKDGDQEKTKKIGAGRVHGYQVEIDPSDRAFSGGIYDEGRRGWLYELKDKPAARAAFKQNDWNKIRVECNGDSIKTWINNISAAELKDDLTPKGFIAFQVHSAKVAGMQIQWRNIMIKELP
jgi:hypothetical protein